MAKKRGRRRKRANIAKKSGRRLIRVGIFDLDEVLPYVFTRDIRHKLRSLGYTYRSLVWQFTSRRAYPIVTKEGRSVALVSMGSHRYQLFSEKGIKCVSCGIEGKYFALERAAKGNPNKYHFNLYGKDRHGNEVMITKDHIVPKSRGGPNKLSNYQTMCFKCNSRKGNKLIK
jgi:hypothetical protein